ncbi:hypothetical protein AAC387_Pa06g2468 [Persea americana]
MLLTACSFVSLIREVSSFKESEKDWSSTTLAGLTAVALAGLTAVGLAGLTAVALARLTADGLAGLTTVGLVVPREDLTFR